MFLVAVGVTVMVFARAEGREFHLPGGDGTIMTIAGGWAGLLIFYRVFDKPAAATATRWAIEWGFFLAFVATGSLAYAGWRMRTAERPEAPLTRRGGRRPRPGREDEFTHTTPFAEEETTTLGPAPARPRRSTPVPADRGAPGRRPRYPPAPSGQMSFEDPPPRSE